MPVRSLVVVASIAALTGGACGPKTVATLPSRPTGTAVTVVLLPDRPGNTVGRLTVTNLSGSRQLDEAREATTVTPNTAPSPPRRLSQNEVNRRFGGAISALPPPPVSFTLHFKFESDELTDESRALVPQVLKVVKARSVPEVTVVGHTDTTGPTRGNDALALKRAKAVRGLLIEAGLAAASVDAISHGERELPIKTPDGVPEPKNRRVDIAVR